MEDELWYCCLVATLPAHVEEDLARTTLLEGLQREVADMIEADLKIGRCQKGATLSVVEPMVVHKVNP